MNKYIISFRITFICFKITFRTHKGNKSKKISTVFNAWISFLANKFSSDLADLKIDPLEFKSKQINLACKKLDFKIIRRIFWDHPIVCSYILNQLSWDNFPFSLKPFDEGLQILSRFKRNHAIFRLESF